MDPAPGPAVLPEHMELIANGDIQPGKVFDLTSRSRAPPRATGTMDERQAMKTLLTVDG